MTILQTVPEYARYLAETFGSGIAVAERQSGFTHLIVNTSTGAASLQETIEDDYLPNGPDLISVITTRSRTASDNCEACEEDGEFAEWSEDAENWDVNALTDEIGDKLTESGVTDASVIAWKLQA
jgi:hypothetical protein